MEVPAVAQKLVKPPEGNARQGGGFAGSTKLWQIADFCLTAKDAKRWLTRVCVCERREVPFRTFPTCLWLHKPESEEPEVAMPTRIPKLLPSISSSEQRRSPPRNDPPAAKALLCGWSRLKDSGRCVYPRPSCHRQEAAPEPPVCSTSALLSQVLYLRC